MLSQERHSAVRRGLSLLGIILLFPPIGQHGHIENNGFFPKNASPNNL